MSDTLDAALTELLGRHLHDTINKHLADGQRAEAAVERVRAESARIRATTPTWHPVANLIDAALAEPGRAATEPAFIKAIDAVICLEGPTITVHDDEITIEGLRIEHPARLTVHAGRRRLNLRHNAFLGDLSTALDVCRDVTCHCHQTKES